MKPFLSRLGGILLAALTLLAVVNLPAHADGPVYPYNNPTYIPNAVADAQNFTIAGDYSFVTNGVGSATVRVTGTRVALSATVDGTSDGTNWTSLQLIPVAGGPTVSSITANGFWRFNVAGFTNIRVHIATLTTGNASVKVVATPGASIVNTVSAGSAYPTSAVAETASSGDVAATSAVATLTASATKTTYITGFTCTGAGATAAATVSVALSGVVTGTMTYIYTTIAGATLAGPSLNVQFNVPVPASAINTPIVVTMPSLGTGNLHAACNATGYQL